mmetsp:Transcript_2550/g.6481  ORF Transcript_2550/g.6481 Transcript_2550/m.6481 type:complete len:207 (-) Transcript_2550:160-780(-)
MESPTNTMSHILFDDTIIVVVRYMMNGLAYLVVGHPWATKLYGLIQCHLGDFTQPARLRGWGACEKHPGSISMVTIQVHSDINVYDISLLKRSIVRYSMADALIHTCAHAFGKPAIIQRRWVRAIINDHLVYCFVDLVGGGARLYKGACKVQNLGRQLACCPHLLNALLIVHLVASRPRRKLPRCSVGRLWDVCRHRQGWRDLSWL